MRESRTLGSVRGGRGNPVPYRDCKMLLQGRLVLGSSAVQEGLPSRTPHGRNATSACG